MPADLDMRAVPFSVLTVAVGAAKTIILPPDDIMIQHMGIQDDAETASDATDKLIAMRTKDAAGDAVVMDATVADGHKMVAYANDKGSFSPIIIPSGTNGPHEIQLQAVGHAAKVQILRGGWQRR